MSDYLQAALMTLVLMVVLALILVAMAGVYWLFGPLPAIVFAIAVMFVCSFFNALNVVREDGAK